MSLLNLPALLTPRITTCSSLANLSACSFSATFCCPTTTACIPLTSSQNTVMCCPSGQDCTYIKPITCDIRLQDAAVYPYNTLHTTMLNGTMATCGEQCCPFGYTCNQEICEMNIVIGDPTTTTSATSSTPTATAISIVAAAASSTPSPTSSSSSTQTKAIILGLMGGILLGIIATSAILLILRHRRRSVKRRRYSAAMFGGKTPRTVSDPFMTPQQYGGAHRSDFLLTTPAAKPRATPTSSGFGSGSTAVGSANGPETPLSDGQMKSRRGSGLPPLFTSPLRFGLPVSPLPVPRRPTREEETRRLVGEQVDEHKYPRVRTPTPPARERGRTMTRQNSDDSYISTGSRTERSGGTGGSSGTINVLMPAPAFVRSERGESRSGGGGGRRAPNTYTTMTLMMDENGSRR